MAARELKPDRGTANGISRGLKSAFAPDSPIDPQLRALIRQADGTYAPDATADWRATQLLERLKRLPWGDGGETNV